MARIGFASKGVILGLCATAANRVLARNSCVISSPGMVQPFVYRWDLASEAFLMDRACACMAICI